MKATTGAVCGAAIFAFGLVLPAWFLFFAAGGSFTAHPEMASVSWVVSWVVILFGAGVGAFIAEELT